MEEVSEREAAEEEEAKPVPKIGEPPAKEEATTDEKTPAPSSFRLNELVLAGVAASVLRLLP